ncbi:hypothetical protein D3C75_368300 [compost metagenome]
MTVETLQVVHQRIRGLFRLGVGRVFLSCQPRHTHFVGDNLHGHRQVQRAVLRIGGNRDMIMTFLQFIIGQAHAFATKHQCDGGMFGFADAFQPAFTRIEHRPRQRTRARAGADHQATAGQGFVQGIDDLRVADHVAGARRKGDGLRVGFDQRVNQPEIG